MSESAPQTHFAVTEAELSRVVAEEPIFAVDSKLYVFALYSVAAVLGVAGIALSLHQREGVSVPGVGLVIAAVAIGSAARPARPKRVLLLEDDLLLVEYQSLVLRLAKEEVVAVVWSPRKTVLTRAGKTAVKIYGLSLSFAEQVAERFGVPLS